MRSVLRSALLAPLAFSLCGCIAMGSIDGRATVINKGAGEAQNRAVLLNLVRASRSEPLYFLAMSRISGSATEDLRVGLPTVIVGPGAPTARNYALGGNATNILDSNTVTSFDLAVLGSKDFYAGLLAPLDLQDVDLLLHQGFARELIFYLVIEKATITPKGGEPFVIYNDPGDPRRFAVFQGYIREAMLHGLTTQSYLAPDDAGSDPAKGRPKLSPHAELCYDRALAAPQARKDFPADANLCGGSHEVRQSAQASNLTVNLHGQPMEIDVATRSIYGVFNYLGAMLARGDSVRLHAYPELPAEVTEDAPLLEVVKGGRLADRGCFVGVGYEGARYCVPEEGAATTKKIFNILNALLALKTAPGDLPVTQTVRIAP